MPNGRSKRYLVSGMVQGVGYRYFVLKVATRLGVTGWVRNHLNGEVEVLGSGSEDQLANFEAALRKGPPSASVTNLQVFETLDEVEGTLGFQVRA